MSCSLVSLPADAYFPRHAHHPSLPFSLGSVQVAFHHLLRGLFSIGKVETIPFQRKDLTRKHHSALVSRMNDLAVGIVFCLFFLLVCLSWPFGVVSLLTRGPTCALLDRLSSADPPHPPPPPFSPQMRSYMKSSSVQHWLKCSGSLHFFLATRNSLVSFLRVFLSHYRVGQFCFESNGDSTFCHIDIPAS